MDNNTVNSGNYLDSFLFCRFVKFGKIIYDLIKVSMIFISLL